MMVETGEDELLCWRERFPILDRTNYLISNSLGAMPAEAADAVAGYARMWAERGVRAWEEGWWELSVELGDEVGMLIGANRGTTVMEPSVTIAHGIVLSGVPFSGARNRVVTDAGHFPSILYLLEGLRERGAEVEIVPLRDGIGGDTARIVDAIDERTAVVALSHVLFRSSYIHDVRSIAAHAREQGALTIVDGYQAVGSIPVDVASLGVDVYIGGCLKWLCGGPGAAFTWVAAEARERLRPSLTGWMAHRRPFGFEPVMEMREDAWRYLVGTPPIASYLAARPGLRIIREVGIEAIRAKSRRQTELLRCMAFERGWRVTTPERSEERAGTVAIDLAEGAAISRALKARDILCDYRAGAGIRLSPHFYTRDDELEEAVTMMVEIERTGAWRGHAATDSPVT